MPYSIRKLPKKQCYRVYNKKTKKTFAKCATLKNAEKQIRLLRALENNKNFIPNSKNRTQKNRK
jgi:hypothetical protein